MDPLSLATSGTALVSVCITITNVLRTIIETHKSCPQELRYLLSRAAGLSIQLHQVDAAKLNLSPVQSAYIGQIFDEEACRKTVHELNDLVWKIHKARSEQEPEEALKKTRVVTTMKWFLQQTAGGSPIDEAERAPAGYLYGCHHHNNVRFLSLLFIVVIVFAFIQADEFGHQGRYEGDSSRQCWFQSGSGITCG
jgi:hypothetical protein